jgi:predicted nucleic acid-binding protein
VTFVYLDSSAIVKLIRQESETEALKGWLVAADQGNPMALASSALASVEVNRAIRRADPAAASKASEVLAHLRFIDVSASVLSLASTLVPASLRSLDAVHLATALTESRGLSAFVTYDSRLATAAAVAGLPAVSPGASEA